MPKTNKAVNVSLVNFTKNIQVNLFIGVALVFVGIFVLFANVASNNIQAMGIGFIILYVGAPFISLAIVGMFLRQTGKLIVEGLGGSIYEGEDDIEPTDEGLEASLVKLLTHGQYNNWLEKGQPELKPWGDLGRPPFDEWLEKNSK